MMAVILGILIYLTIGGIIGCLIKRRSCRFDVALFAGIIWPVVIPLFMGLVITSIISVIIEFFTKNKKH